MLYGFSQTAIGGNGYVEEAYAEIRPMIDRVIRNKGFYEWYGKGDRDAGSLGGGKRDSPVTNAFFVPERGELCGAIGGGCCAKG